MVAKVDSELVEAISKVPLFSDCTAKQHRSIAANARVLNKEPGETIVEEGSGGVAFFVVLDGEVEIGQQGEAVATLGSGDHFGELALLAHEARNASATAKTPARLATLTRWDFTSLVTDDPKLCYRLLQTVATRAATS